MFLLVTCVSLSVLLITHIYSVNDKLHEHITSSEAVLDKALSAGDWDLVLVIVNNLKKTAGFSYLYIQGIGSFGVPKDIGFFSICETKTTPSVLVGTIKGCIPYFDKIDTILTFACCLFFLLLFLIYKKAISNSVTDISKELINSVASVEKFLSLRDDKNEQIKYKEFVPLFNEINKTIKEIGKLESNARILKNAQQVSHDIRSPLAALEMLSGNIYELPEEKRLIIKNSINRIKDIANSLVTKSTSSNKIIEIPHERIVKSSSQELTLLAPLIEIIVTEKRVQYKNLISIEIEFNQTKESYGLFSKINPNEFKRLLSNLVTNAVEAMEDKSGRVTIVLSSNTLEKVTISVQDNGKGIPEEIIPKLCVRGATFGKAKGNGLGLFHAQETISSWNGVLSIKSKIDWGTDITIMLPREMPPKWFVANLKIRRNTVIVIFDDDVSIHQIWRGRFDSINASTFNINLIHISSIPDFRSFYRANFADLESAIFLMDYEIAEHIESGIDLIEQFGIHNQSILVTSRYEEPLIREKCERLAIKMIPKSMSGFIPIEIL